VLAVPKSIAISPDTQLNGFENELKNPIIYFYL
jgi:hypothetical protein